METVSVDKEKEIGIFDTPITLGTHLEFNAKDYQEEFIDSCLEHPRVLGVWTRQGGKTTSMGLFMVWECLLIPNLKYGVITPMQEHYLEFFAKVKELIDRSEIVKQHIVRCTAELIVWDNGSSIKFLATGPYGTVIRGKTFDRIVLDETQNHKAEIVRRAIIPTGATRPNLKIFLLGTGYAQTGFFFDSYKSGKYKVHQYDWSYAVRSGLITQAYIDEQRDDCTDYEFACEYGAQFVDFSDCYFEFELLESCIDEGYSMVRID